VRTVSPTAFAMQQWFDRGMYRPESEFHLESVCSGEDLEFPSNALRLTTGYMRTITDAKRRTDMLSYLQVKLDIVLTCRAIDDYSQEGHNAHGCAKTVSGIISKIARDLYDCEDRQAFVAMVQPNTPVDIASTLDDLQILEEYQVRQLVEQVLFDSPDARRIHMVSETHATQGAFVRAIGDMADVKEGQAAFAVNKARFLRLEMEKMDWAHKLRRKCPGLYDSPEQLRQVFMQSGLNVLSMVNSIVSRPTVVQKVRLWAEALLAALACVNDAMPPGSEPLGGPDLPEVALFLICHADNALYTHAQLTRIFTIDYMGEDVYSHPDLPQDVGLYQDIHNQYTYDAEKRSVYPQMMLNYLLDSLDLISSLEADEDPDSPHAEALDADAERVARSMAEKPPALATLTRDDHEGSRARALTMDNAPSKRSSAPTAMQSNDNLAVGDHIIITGSRNPSMNGKSGFIKAYNPNHQRYEVILDDGLKIMVRSENIMSSEHSFRSTVSNT